MHQHILSDFDRNGNRVFLPRRRWFLHILERHPEVEPYLEQVANVMKEPDIITIDLGGAYHYAKQGVMAGHPNLYLDVVIVYTSSSDFTTGEIVTIFFNSRIPKGGVHWTKQMQP